MWNGGFAVSQPEAASLYRLRLGKPLGDEVEENGVYWRAFEAGLVAVNPERKKEGFIALRPPDSRHAFLRSLQRLGRALGPL